MNPRYIHCHKSMQNIVFIMLKHIQTAFLHLPLLCYLTDFTIGQNDFKDCWIRATERSMSFLFVQLSEYHLLTIVVNRAVSE